MYSETQQYTVNKKKKTTSMEYCPFEFVNQQLCSSGCNSGWTLYLDHSSIPDRKRSKLDEDDDTADLSMLSDASSGPPHLHLHLHLQQGEEEEEEEESCYGESDTVGYVYRRRKTDGGNRRQRVHHLEQVQDQRSSSSCLDDTASSSFSDFTTMSTNQTLENDVLKCSQGHSTTQFEPERPSCEKYYDFFLSRSPLSGNQLQQKYYHGLFLKTGDAKK